jgi:hypothetical protein
MAEEGMHTKHVTGSHVMDVKDVRDVRAIHYIHYIHGMERSI